MPQAWVVQGIRPVGHLFTAPAPSRWYYIIKKPRFNVILSKEEGEE